MTADSVPVRPARTVELGIIALEGANRSSKRDAVVTEEPLELRLVAGNQSRTLAVTMRTPGNDFELAGGFAVGEGIVRSRRDLAGLTYCRDRELDTEQRYNVVNITLTAAALPDLDRLERHFVMTSACGVCGRAQLAALRDSGMAKIDDDVRVAPEMLYELPEKMREAQRVFASTGGLHAAALFTSCGELLAVREDVGRHNAVDKIVGWGLLADRLPFGGSILMVSGRAGYEILQKSAVARIPVVCSVSAPSSLAIDLAREFDITLLGFVRAGRANVYSGLRRVDSPP